ncbi:MAG: ModE family transcriptional regulator [Pseudomonadota bacterium]
MPRPSQPSPTSPKIEARFRLRVTLGSDIAIGPGKIDLLEAIREHGSITQAAREIGMSYRRGWLLLDELNRSLRKPATACSQGGLRGGGCLLTPEGEALIALYREIEQRAEHACAQQLASLTQLIVKS